MKSVGVIGLGDMGIGIAANLAKAGFELSGFDLRPERLQALAALGGTPAESPRTVAESCDAVFVMVLTGQQVKHVVSGENGLLAGFRPGSTLIVSASITPAEMREVAGLLDGSGIDLIDTPVSGGKAGADAGTLTLMTAAKEDVLERNRDVLQAVSGKILHVGEEAGMGQTVKATLQAVFGAYFSGIFEALVLGAKAGVPGKILYEVFTNSGLASPALENCTRLILDRRFKGTGSHIGTMYKDLGITMGLARETGAAMFTASAAYELFQAGKSRYPDEDNWAIVKLLEEIAGTQVKW